MKSPSGVGQWRKGSNFLKNRGVTLSTLRGANSQGAQRCGQCIMPHVTVSGNHMWFSRRAFAPITTVLVET